MCADNVPKETLFLGELLKSEFDLGPHHSDKCSAIPFDHVRPE
jgi:hypothetical protein